MFQTTNQLSSIFELHRQSIYKIDLKSIYHPYQSPFFPGDPPPFCCCGWTQLRPGRGAWVVALGVERSSGRARRRSAERVNQQGGFSGDQFCGWWFFATPLKNMSSSVGMMTATQSIYIYIWENKQWQPNHQPEKWALNGWNFRGI